MYPMYLHLCVHTDSLCPLLYSQRTLRVEMEGRIINHLSVPLPKKKPSTCKALEPKELASAKNCARLKDTSGYGAAPPGKLYKEKKALKDPKGEQPAARERERLQPSNGNLFPIKTKAEAKFRMDGCAQSFRQNQPGATKNE